MNAGNRTSRNRLGVVVVAIVAVAWLLAACSSSSGTQPSGASSAKVDPASFDVLIDVRDPAEFAAGHLTGAIDLSLNDGTFAAELSSLDPSKSYAVYCRSGSRSSRAVAMMRDAGITEVVDLGSMDAAASATGLAVVK